MKQITKLFTNLTLSLGLLLSTTLLLPLSHVQAAVDTGAKKAVCQGLGVASSDGCKESTTSVESIVKTIITILSAVVAIVAIIMIIIAGIKFALSGGDSNAASSARNTILYALVGLVVVFLAQVLVHYVLFRVQK